MRLRSFSFPIIWTIGIRSRSEQQAGGQATVFEPLHAAMNITPKSVRV
jgi:hypothetical protein